MAGSDTIRGISPAELAAQLQGTIFNTGNSFSGVATGGTNTTLQDTTKDLEPNILANTAVNSLIILTIGGVTYYRVVTANTNNTITFDALPGGVVVTAGLAYAVVASPKASSPASSVVAGFTIANWNAGEQDLVSIGLAATRYKVHSFIVNIIATGGNITIRMYTVVNGVQTRVYPPNPLTWSIAGGDSPGVAIINGTFGIHDVLRITCQSDAPGDNGVAISYDGLLETM